MSIDLNKLHTTLLGEERIKRNLKITNNPVEYCKNKIKNSHNIIRKGKNYYIEDYDCIITVNAYSYTIITAHRKKEKQ